MSMDPLILTITRPERNYRTRAYPILKQPFDIRPLFWFTVDGYFALVF